MAQDPIHYYLKKLEEYRCEDLQVSRRGMANELGIPPGTYKNWYRTKNKTSPSSRYANWIKAFLESRDIISPGSWIEKEAPQFLNQLGIVEGQTAMDFGCGNGDYTLILARVVGEHGKVYAVDKNRDRLGELLGRAHGHRLTNIEPIQPHGTEPPVEIPLPDGSVDVAWCSDVLHDGYFEEDELKNKLLQDIRRLLKADGFIAVHPVHMAKERLRGIIQDAGFFLEGEYNRPLLFHGNEFHEGDILKFVPDGKDSA